ncbi:1-deoxy-D-xylulose-5-phosphate synthase [mine drainage metagenome]|uniref:1-deoxy-D-xylulose-5-phosphate synthase n=1 Tax=mine drainage metagenome TaxID=410659 RepID=T1B443_9ZZZZ
MVRYPRGVGTGVAAGSDLATVPVGKAELRRHGHTLALLVFGAPLAAAARVAEALDLTLVNMRFIKPLDTALLTELARDHAGFVSIEDNVIAGGAGSGVGEWLATQGLTLPLLQLGLPDHFQEHASREQLLAEAGLDAAGIEAAIRRRYATLLQRPRTQQTG